MLTVRGTGMASVRPLSVRVVATRLLSSPSNQCRLRLMQSKGRLLTTEMQPMARGREDLVLLYENNQGRRGYFKLITLVSGVQMLFWGYISYFVFTELRDEKADIQAPGLKQDQSKTLRLLSFDFSSLKWRIGLSLLALGAGALFAVTACMYPLRMITQLYFIRSSAAVQIHTHTPLGTGRFLEVPLTDVTSSGDRPAPGSHLSLKIRGYPMYFLVDKQNGRFLSPRLFDTLIGARRNVV